MATLLIIDDEEKIRSLLARILELEGYHILKAENGAGGLAAMEKENVDVILSDIKLPDMNGLDLLEKIKARYPTSEVIMLTAYGTIHDGVKAIKSGAFDYITKGNDNERIIPLVFNAVEKVRLQQRIESLENRIYDRFNFSSILGTSKILRNAISLAEKVSFTSTSVLLQGETGTGKEIFAQAIHHSSSRKTKNFVAINCSGFSREIMESELFGYRAGAFTGALKNKKGLFEEADGGTLFLDEVGEIPIDIQAKLLRVLENGTFLKVGDVQEKKVNARIITATNRDLKKAVEEGSFREDLYFRISTFVIQLPPLRERLEDIELLARFFIKEYAKKIGTSINKIDPAFLERLKKHSWKGNIRELKNVMERSVILAENREISVTDLPDDILSNESKINLSSYELADMEAQHISRVIKHVHGNKAEAARLLNIGISTLYRKIEEYGLTTEGA